MTIEKLLLKLNEKKISLSVIDNELIIRGKKLNLDKATLNNLRDKKTELIDFILANNYQMPNSGANEIKVPPNLIPLNCTSITPDMLPLISLNQTDINYIINTVPGGTANIQDIYALGPLQEGILFHHLLAEQGDTYLLSSLMAFDNRKRLDDFLEAMQAIIARHDILRTAVISSGISEPAQVVWREATLPVKEVEFDVAKGDIATQLAERFDPRHYRIDLNTAPLLHAFITYDSAQDRWLIALMFHHLAIDHTTLEIIVDEVKAYQKGHADQLSTPQPFRNFIAQVRSGVQPKEHEEFFRNMLGSLDETTAPFGLMNAQGDGSDIKEIRLNLEETLAQRIRERAQAAGVSAASIFHLAWAQVLAQTSGRKDVAFGTVLFGRMQGGAGADHMLGMFINTLPICIHVGLEGPLKSIRQVHALLIELLHHEHASLTLAQRCSAVPAGAPLFTSLLNYRHSTENVSINSDSVWEGVEFLSGEERTNYPITLSVDDLGKDFALTAQTVSAVAPERICSFMQTALDQLITALEITPDKALHSIEVLPAAERQTVLYDWNDTKTDYPQNKCIHELFEDQVTKSPEAIAVVYEEEQLTYAELNTQANQLAHYLRSLGVGPDQLVGICVERGLNMMVGLLAILKAGGAYVPLDPTYPQDRLSYMLEDSAPVALLVESNSRKVLANISKESPRVDLVEDQVQWNNLSIANPKRKETKLTPKNLAYVIYTSGSTGKPKGVMNEHRGITNRLIWMQSSYELDQHDVILQKTPFSFDVSVWEFFWPVLTGASLVIAKPEGHKEPAYIYETIQRKNITTLHFVPPMLQLFLECKATFNCPSLTRVICSGEALPAILAKKFHQQLPKTELHNLYGPTEAAVDVTAWCCTKEVLKDSIPIGRPIANTHIYLLDPQGNPVPIGVTGELYIAGAQIARGYLNRPELTAERFLPDPFVADKSNARMYKTGDLARWLPDGNLEFIGRNDFQVKIRGFRIELGEIEARLTEHSALREVTVIAREDSPGNKRLVAYYTGSEDVVVEDLRNHLIETLPDYMVPAAYVHLEALPLTPNGKLDRKALPAPEDDAYATRVYEEPQGNVEQQLAQIWAELLKVERVGRHDNFFELGGHSLLILQVASLARRKRVEVTVAAIFSNPTIASLSIWIAKQNGSVQEPYAIPLRQSGSKSPLFLVHEVSGEILYGPQLTQHIDSEIPVYGLEGQAMHEITYKTIQAMAARLIKMMRAVQPTGPYRLAGWSLGGTIAYEIASQLIGEDESIEFLGLLDTYYFQGIPENMFRLSSNKNKSEEQDCITMLLELLESSNDYVTSTAEAKLKIKNMNLMQLIRKCRDFSILPEHLMDEEIKKQLLRVRNHLSAESSYRAQKLPLNISLFSTKEFKKYLFRGWDSVLPKEKINLIPIPGSHTSMVLDPNVETLGKSISRAISKVNKKSMKPTTPSPLVMIQAGTKGVAPIFCVPGAGGNVGSLTELALAFNNSRPIYGLQAQGLFGDAIPHSSVSAAAKAYIQAIKLNHSGQSFHLLGHSFGGWVVFEMAKILNENGLTPTSTVLIDTEVPDQLGGKVREYSRTDVLMKLVEVYEQSAKLKLALSPEDFDGIEYTAQLATLHKTLLYAGLLPKQSKPEILDGTLRTFDTALRTHYYPSIYTGNTHLILAQDNNIDVKANKKQNDSKIKAWSKWAPNMTHWETQANHMSILKSPNVNEMVSWLKLD